jgi:hypothetical protein
MAVAANLDSAGLDVKQAQGRLPKDLTLITAIMARLWDQVFEPVWTKVIVPWLRGQKMESSVQSYLLCENIEGVAHHLFSMSILTFALTKLLMLTVLLKQRSIKRSLRALNGLLICYHWQ